MTTPTKASKQTITIETIANAVVTRFLDTGKPSSAAEIAETIGCSVSTVNKRLDEAQAFVTGCHVYKESRPSRSRDYPDFYSGRNHSVLVYEPTPALLRDIILRDRGWLAVYDQPEVGGNSAELIAHTQLAAVRAAKP